MSFGTLSDGRFVAALSYSSEAEPFVFLVGKDSKSTPPWSCNAGPAELDVNGSDVWVHCIDPKSSDDRPRIHFWHTGDAGRTWTRAGALDEAIAMGRYAIGGGKLFLTGSVDGNVALLWVVARANGKWHAAEAELWARERTEDKWPGMVSKSIEWPSDAQSRLAASDDGSQLRSLASETMRF